MANFVDMVFTETNLMTKKQFLLRGGISADIEGSHLLKIKENDFGTAAPDDELDLTDFPDLGQPLPEVSLREQLRLTAMHRRQVLSWQRLQQQHFLEMWDSRSGK
ncbi:hypothetical protein KR032_009085 [Drosophila birchii]|nr:hypothetical protein KR032_009085 [Drosophila birchii]